jgi:hypothetical protein
MLTMYVYDIMVAGYAHDDLPGMGIHDNVRLRYEVNTTDNLRKYTKTLCTDIEISTRI